MQNEKSTSQISIKLRYLYSIIMVRWIILMLYWILIIEISKKLIFNIMIKQSLHSYQCRILMSVQELKKQQDDYGNSHQIIPFDGRAPQNLTLEMRWWKLAPSVLVVCIYSVSSKRSNIKSEDDKGKHKKRNTRFWS